MNEEEYKYEALEAELYLANLKIAEHTARIGTLYGVVDKLIEYGERMDAEIHDLQELAVLNNGN